MNILEIKKTMKKIERTTIMSKYYLLLSLFIALFILNGCGGSGSVNVGDGALSGVNPTATPSNTALNEVSRKVDILDGVIEGLTLAGIDYDIGGETSRIDALAVELPRLPSTPPDIPSSTPASSKSVTYPLGNGELSISWYLYSSPSSWLEWKGSQRPTGQAAPVAHFYGEASQATDDDTVPLQVKRNVIISRWLQNNTFLRSYTKGEASYNLAAPNVISLSGTQVILFLEPIGTKSYIACDFSAVIETSGVISGTAIFDNGRATFNRAAVNVNAIGTENQYSATSGTLTLTSPVEVTITFSHVSYGDGTMVFTKTVNNVVTTLSYSGDGSGSGTVVGSGGKTTTLVWDSTGKGTATVVTVEGEQSVSIYVPQPYTPLLADI